MVVGQKVDPFKGGINRVTEKEKVFGGQGLQGRTERRSVPVQDCTSVKGLFLF